MNASDISEARARRPAPFRVRDASEFVGKTPPERDWLIPSVLMRRTITLLSGDGGVGKSLLCLQLQVAAAICKPWLSIEMPVDPVSSFGMYCEDDDDEIFRRLDKCCKHYGVTMADLGDRVRWISRVGQDNELITFKGRNEQATAVRTALFTQVMEEIKNWGHQLVIIDTAADTFAGNENIRPQVRSYVNAIRNYALVNNGGVVLNSHPSKSAMADGSGFSGSTAWNGSVRNRLYFTKPKAKGDDEDDDGPTDERVLKVMKSNYGPFGARIKCAWNDGVFIAQAAQARGKSTYEKLDDERRVLLAVEYLVKKGTMVSAAANAPNRVSALVRKLPSCKEITVRAVESAVDRLIEVGKLIQVELGPPSKRRLYVRPGHLRFPGEDNGGATEPEHPTGGDDEQTQKDLL